MTGGRRIHYSCILFRQSDAKNNNVGLRQAKSSRSYLLSLEDCRKQLSGCYVSGAQWRILWTLRACQPGAFCYFGEDPHHLRLVYSLFASQPVISVFLAGTFHPEGTATSPSVRRIGKAGILKASSRHFELRRVAGINHRDWLLLIICHG